MASEKPVIHAGDHDPGSADPYEGDWVYVGTTGVDGVDALLTDPSPPFENSWTNAGGDWEVVRFRKGIRGPIIEGGYTDGAFGTTMFTLPTRWRPAKDIVSPGSTSAGDYRPLWIKATGEVVPLSP